MSSETTPCPVPGCSKALTKRGMRGHMIYAHGVKPDGASASSVSTEKQTQEVKPMSEGCVDCKLKDRDIKGLNENIARAQADKAAAVQEAAEAQQRIKGLTAEVEKAKQPPSEEAITAALRKHLAECPTCRKAAIEAMPADERTAVITEYAEAMGIAPKKIVIRWREDGLQRKSRNGL